jgi:hypothetical protein
MGKKQQHKYKDKHQQAKKKAHIAVGFQRPRRSARETKN